MIHGSKTLDHQEWHLALEMPTGRMAQAKRERENIKTKPEQLKFSKTHR
jgi:hypothetical protein